MQIRAIASKAGYFNSGIMIENYTITPVIEIIGIGGSYCVQWIHLSDGRTYAHGYNGWNMGCPGSEEDPWASYCDGDHDGDPILISSDKNLITSEGDAWNDCGYHLSSDGECWFSGDEDTYCRGGCPDVSWGKLYRMVLTDTTGTFAVGETIEDDDGGWTYLTYIRGIITSVSGTSPNVTLEYYKCASQNFSASTGPFTGRTSGAKATAVTPVDLGNLVPDYGYGWTPRWYDQWPCGRWDNWYEEPTPYGGGDEVERYNGLVLMFKENKNIVKLSGMGHGGIAIDSNRKLWCWGYRGWGIIDRDDPPDNRMVQCDPWNVKSDWDWIDCAGGYFHCAAVRSDGTLWVWGVNSYAQMGIGLPLTPYIDSFQMTPAQIGTDTDWVKCWAPHENTVAQKSDGTVWYTGDYCHGEFGNGWGNQGKTYYSGACSGLYLNEGMVIGGGGKEFVLFDVGYGNSIGVDRNGVTWVWGTDYRNGALGQGDWGVQSGYFWGQTVPIQLGGGTPEFKVVFSDGDHMIGVALNNDVWYWGELYDRHWVPTKIDFDFVTGE